MFYSDPKGEKDYKQVGKVRNQKEVSLCNFKLA